VPKVVHAQVGPTNLLDRVFPPGQRKGSGQGDSGQELGRCR
jgi:hypothetical protein